MNASLAAALTVVMTLTLLLAPAAAMAQEPVKSFDRLNTRLKVGDTIYVTDARGRAIKGKIRTLDPSALTLDHDGPETIQADAVRLITERRSGPVGRGALYGLIAGAAGGAILGASAAGGPGGECNRNCSPILAGVFGGLGAGAGAVIGAVIPGKTLVVYRAPGAPPSTLLTLAPVITPRTKGMAVSFAF
jgi:hypothetical protein